MLPVVLIFQNFISEFYLRPPELKSETEFSVHLSDCFVIFQRIHMRKRKLYDKNHTIENVVINFVFKQ